MCGAQSLTVTQDVHFEHFMEHVELVAEVVDSNDLPQKEQLNIQDGARDGILEGEDERRGHKKGGGEERG